MIKFKGSATFRPQINILASHHFTSFPAKLERGSKLAVTHVDPDDGKIKQVVLAGTVFPSNDAKAEGIILNDYDVTYGDANIAIVTHGVIKACALPEEVTAEAKAALKHIQFRENIIKLQASLVCPKPDQLVVGEEGEFTSILILNNASFLPLAEYKDNWGFGAPTGSKGEILEAKLLTEKLISIKVKGLIKEAGKVTLQPNPKITTAKATIDAVEVGQAIAPANKRKGDK